MSSTASYNAYDVETPQLITQLQPKRKTLCKRFTKYSCVGLSYFFVAYLAANATLITCLKTNCTLPHSSTNTTIVPYNMSFLITSEGTVLMFLFFTIIYRCYFYKY